MCAHAEKIKEVKSLAADLCDQCTQDCRGRLQILDSQIEAHRDLMDDLDRKLATLERGINKLRSLYAINMRLLNLINAPEKEGGTAEEKEI